RQFAPIRRKRPRRRVVAFAARIVLRTRILVPLTGFASIDRGKRQYKLFFCAHLTLAVHCTPTAKPDGAPAASFGMVAVTILEQAVSKGPVCNVTSPVTHQEYSVFAATPVST